jgi:cobalt/nickel transport system permease protein
MPFLILMPPDPTALRAAQMHAADGFLSVPVAAVMWLVTIGVIAISVQRANRHLDERMVPLMGVMAAFVFAAQMFNFPVAGGTSGHLLGGVLAAVLLGPWVGTLVMASVIAVQGLVFQDGGLLAMGANIFNMGIIGTMGGFAIYMTIAKGLGGEDRGRLPAAGIAAWLAVVSASMAMSLELVMSGTSTVEVVFPALVGTHMLIGIGEALITVAALGFIQVVRPDLFRLRDAAGGQTFAPATQGAS